MRSRTSHEQWVETVTFTCAHAAFSAQDFLATVSLVRPVGFSAAPIFAECFSVLRPATSPAFLLALVLLRVPVSVLVVAQAVPVMLVKLAPGVVKVRRLPSFLNSPSSSTGTPLWPAAAIVAAALFLEKAMVVLGLSVVE